MPPEVVDDSSRDEDVCSRRCAEPDEYTVLKVVEFAEVAIVIAETAADDGEGRGDDGEEEDQAGEELLSAAKDVHLSSVVGLRYAGEDASEGCADGKRP